MNNQDLFISSSFLWGSTAAISIWLSFPNDLISFPPAALLWPIAIVAITAASPIASVAMRVAWISSWAGCFAALYWLCLPVMNVGELPMPLALACAALISFCLSSQSALFSLLCFYTRQYPPWLKATLLALAWGLLEYTYALVAGFPWLALAGAMAQWPIMVQAASIFGSYFLTSIWLFVSLFLYYAFKREMKPRPAIIISSAICMVLVSYGEWRIKGPAVSGAEAPDELSVVMIEGNIDQNQKWTPAFQKISLEKYINLTDRALGERGHSIGAPDLAIWPETALPFFFERNPVLAEKTRNAVRRWGITLLFGAPGVEIVDNSDLVFNRAFLLGPDGETLDWYDKRHLVPFGEYLPDWLRFSFLEALLQGVGIYQEGNSASPLRYNDLALGMLICYEAIFPWLAQASVSNGANILVDLSNDAWFGSTPAARQHLFQTALRCIEQERWLLRATNTGISAAIDPYGRITKRGKMFESGFLECTARLTTNLTIFHRIHELLPLCGLALFIILVFMGRKQSIEKKERG